MPADPEPQGSAVEFPLWRLLVDHARVTPEVTNWKYEGSGSEDDPYVVDWIPNDPGNPLLFPKFRKWLFVVVMALATLAVAFNSSAYSGGVVQIIEEFHADEIEATLGVSLFVLGFALGPLIWAPLSELYGRQVMFIGTYGALTAFNAGAAGAQNLQTLLVLRFFAGAFGSSPLTNAGGVIADLFFANDRGLAMALFAAAPFLGPTLGPLVGGFLGTTEGWRWIQGLLAIFSGALWIIGSLIVPETYPIVILRKRATKLSQMTGKVYRSSADMRHGPVKPLEAFRSSLIRPWILLFREPIVLILSIYMAIIYGTLYMEFSAFPIVFQQQRGWTEGIGGLAFLGLLVGMMSGVAYMIFYENGRYVKVAEESGGVAPPEARLPCTVLGGILIPIGLFWFAWTDDPGVHYMASIAASVPFGTGMVLIFLGMMNYLIDSYTIFAASVLAANSVLRSLFGFAFPLFTADMYDSLGIHWGASIPAFLALACVPFPLVLYRMGAPIRERCKYAAESSAFMAKMAAATRGEQPEPEKDSELDETNEGSETERDPPQAEQGDTGYADIRASMEQEDRPKELHRSHTSRSTRTVRDPILEINPFDIDRVNTKESFGPAG